MLFTEKFAPALQAIEVFVQSLVIPFISDQLVIVVDDRESIDQMGAQERIHILWREFPCARSVLGPVGEVANHLGGSGC